MIVTDAHINLCNGRYFYVSQVSSILQRYYEHFGKLTVCARVVEINEPTSTHVDVTDMVEKIIKVPSIMKAMLGLYNKRIRDAVAESDFIICRCPGIISHRAADMARKFKKTYFTESMGCGWDAYFNHGILGKIVAPYVFFKMKQTVYHSNYALYVTNEFLQNRYPCKNESVGASNVLIENVDEAILQKRLEKISNFDGQNITLMTTAAIDVRYKGQEFVIKAIPQLNKCGIRVKYMLIGGGDNAFLKSVARKYGVEDQVEFVGRRTLSEVFELLDEADIYIQPSLQEGLPRSIIEAMSRACPVIGARTAGIPELIEDKFVVKRKSASDIANKIRYFVELGHDKQSETAKRNFEESKNYLDSVLSDRRTKFYEKVKKDLQK